MKLFPRVVITLAALLVAMGAYAQPESPCTDCQTYCSFTPGGWGAPCQGENAGCLRDLYFATVFPFGMTLGGNFTMHFTSALAVENFYPEGGTPNMLTQDHIDPIVTESGVFGGHMVAFTLNLEYSNAGIGGASGLGDLVIATGPFAGYTVDQLAVVANAVLGGDASALPPGVTVSDVNDAVSAINNNFDNCEDNDGYLIVPPQGQTVVVRGEGQELPLQFCLEFTEQCPDICVVWWCSDCGPADFAIFTECADDTTCAFECPPAGGLTWGEQLVYEVNPDGSCWWYVPVRAATPGCVCITFEQQLSVSLTDFSAVPGNGEVRLGWTTASERNNARFELERSSDNAAWTTVARVNGQGTSTGAAHYSVTDDGLTNGRTYSYRLVSVDLGGTSEYVGSVITATPSLSAGLPNEYALYQNYPNPFNPGTSIAFDLADAGVVTLKVYNMVGQEVATLAHGLRNAGHHVVSFDARDLPSALYLYKLEVNGFTSTQKMLLIK